MMSKFLLVVALSGAGIRPGEDDNRGEFGRIENRDRLKGLIQYLRQPAHGRQESAVEGQYHWLDRTGQTSRSKLQNYIPLYLDHCEKAARHVDLRKNWLNEDGRCVSTLDNILISPTADVRDQAIEKSSYPMPFLPMAIPSTKKSTPTPILWKFRSMSTPMSPSTVFLQMEAISKQLVLNHLVSKWNVAIAPATG